MKQVGPQRTHLYKKERHKRNFYTFCTALFVGKCYICSQKACITAIYVFDGSGTGCVKLIEY